MNQFAKKLIRTLVLSALTVLMTTAFASAAEGDLAIAVGCTTATDLNFRKGNSTDAAIITRLDTDLPVSVLDDSDPDWFRINYNGTVGYVSSKYLTVDQDNEFEAFGRVNASSVNVREEATVDSAAITQLSMGTVVSVTGLEDGWFFIVLDDETTGYIRSDFLDLVKEASATAASANGSAVVALAEQYLGTKYVYGGAAPGGFDCSGYTLYVYKQFGITNLPHTASGQWTGGYGTKITARDQLLPGDLVFFNDPSRSGGKACSHAGIYVGNGTFIHASSAKAGVVYSSLNDPYYNRYYVGAIRLV